MARTVSDLMSDLVSDWIGGYIHITSLLFRNHSGQAIISDDRWLLLMF